MGPEREACAYTLSIEGDEDLMVPLQEQEAEELKSELDDIKKSEKDRASRIRRLEKEIDEYEKRLANPPEMEDLDEISGPIVRFLILFDDVHGVVCLRRC